MAKNQKLVWIFMKEALIVLCVSQPLTVGAFLWAFRSREKAERAERTVLLNRIQAPREAVIQTLDLKDGPPAVNIYDDADYEQ